MGTRVCEMKECENMKKLITDEIGYIGQEHSRTFLSREGVRKYLLVLQMFME